MTEPAHPSDVPPSQDDVEGGDPVCWAHLFDDPGGEGAEPPRTINRDLLFGGGQDR